MRKTTLVQTLLVAMLLSVVSGTRFISLISANPTPQPPMPETPDLHEPSVTIQLPENNKAYNLNNVQYSLTVKPPFSWFDYNPVHGVIMSISYILDEDQKVTISSTIAYYEQGPFTFKGTLSDLSEGNHSIQVYVRSDSFYAPPNRPQPPFSQIPPEDYYLDTYSDWINFTIDTISPTISNLSIENKTYKAADVPLNFAISEATSGITYCLDNVSNVTIAGNTTLKGLSTGAHNVTLYAWDTAGNVGPSQTVGFNIAEEPVLPWSEPFPTTFIVAVFVASVAVVDMGLAIYLKKRKH